MVHYIRIHVVIILQVSKRIHYRLQRSWGKVIFSQAYVILFTGGLGVCLSACWDTTPSSQGSPRWQGRPPPPGKADPPCTVHAGRYGQQAGGMHPSGMQFLLNSLNSLTGLRWRNSIVSSHAKSLKGTN